MTKSATAESFTFEAEVQQLLHLMVNSLYTHKEVFLRELISNASDATDRLRFAALTDSSLVADGDELAITVEIDKDNKTLTISDRGIGMNRDEVIENIGTIARSGTKEFVSALSGEQTKDANLIGQFGVGFYSVFMVADRVTLSTRKAGEPDESGVRWTSAGTGEYSLESVTQAHNGTSVTLHLRDSESEFLENFRVRHIISKYSDHVSLPIRMPREVGEQTDSEQGETASTEGKWDVVNKGSALWSRPKNEISEEEYQGLYSSLSYDPEPPLATLHNRVEGKQEYVSLLFIPSKAPFDLWDRDRQHGVKLYVRRIFIMDDTKHLMPAYLRFVRGIIDSSDLPLNVSREFLQHNKDIDRIRAASVKKVLAEIKKIAQQDNEKYQIFWTEFGKAFKEGIVEDADNRQSISELLRFATTEDGPEQTVALDTYVKRMPMKQKAIYYITAESHAAAASSPHLEIFRKHDIEVLLLSDPIDEWLVSQLTEFADKPLKSVAKGALDLDELGGDSSSEKKHKETTEEFGGLATKLKEILDGKVKDVRISQRLTDSPACLVADEHDLGGNLERILQAVGQDAPGAKPILEINPNHPLIRNLSPEHAQLDDWALVLFDQAALSEGARLSEPADFVRRMNTLLVAAGTDQSTADSS